MKYPDAIQFLYELQMFGAQLGLDAPRRLAALAGNPHEELQFIHVAGTNGKGSTCAMLESIYRASGRRVGLYTSPHLVSFRERIQVNHELVSEADVVQLVEEASAWLKTFGPDEHPTFFEVITVMALRYFAEKKCDLVVWETGLGGRLDATNIVIPLASVITNVQLDHEAWLGDTLEKIAGEKAGIVKPRVPVITAASEPALSVIRAAASQNEAPLTVVTSEMVASLQSRRKLGLRGEHQWWNAALAAQTAKVLEGSLPLAEGVIHAGLAGVHWPGRLQVVQRGAQTFLLDGAHNPAGAESLAQALHEEFGYLPVTLILGVLADKKCAEICRVLAVHARRVLTVPVASRRSAPAQEIAALCREANPQIEVAAAGSLAESLSRTAQDSFVVITGSLYLVGEALQALGLSAEHGNERGLNEWRPR